MGFVFFWLNLLVSCVFYCWVICTSPLNKTLTNLQLAFTVSADNTTDPSWLKQPQSKQPRLTASGKTGITDRHCVQFFLHKRCNDRCSWKCSQRIKEMCTFQDQSGRLCSICCVRGKNILLASTIISPILYLPFCYHGDTVVMWGTSPSVVQEKV